MTAKLVYFSFNIHIGNEYISNHIRAFTTFYYNDFGKILYRCFIFALGIYKLVRVIGRKHQ